MDLATVLSAAQTFFAALQCSELKSLSSILRYKSDLDTLKQTVNTVKAMLDDAESTQDQVPLLSQAQLYVDQLKDVVYDADDLFDELVTLAELQKLKKGGNVSQKVRPLFSCFNSLGVAHSTSRRVMEISNKFNAIASNHNNFSCMLDHLNFKLDSDYIRRRRDTCSYENSQDIVGRKDDVEKIVSRLLDPIVQHDVSCLAIVGIGGLGKTSLAQLVYNDPRIEKEFPLRMWTCVSDEGQRSLDVKAILCKILGLIKEGNCQDLELEHLQKQLREKLVGKKFFLVLDDVWNEDRLQWLDLEKFLKSGLLGSWILVTTRSEKTATAIGDEHPHKLKGLSDEDSWNLFEIMAFGQKDKQPCSSDLEEIGREIVKRCANVPLAIRVVGSLLYGHGKDKWISFQKIGLGRLKNGKNGGIEPILKLSYHQLEFPLKTCFGYCALFPKDYRIEKEMLINLWMAQDYIVPLHEGQTIEDAGEEYFSFLVKRCFFQDVKKDEYHNIISCKIHDLMHDIAQQVAAKEVQIICSLTTLDNKIRHVFYVHVDVSIKRSFTNKIRTCLYLWEGVPVDMIVRKFPCLRTLNLTVSWTKDISSALGKLLHLRYLDLSNSGELETLPKSITKLLNLQILNLRNCQRLKKLPEDLPSLVNLRVLDVDQCYMLVSMPRGMGKLSCLRKLPVFIIGCKNSTLEQTVFRQYLEDLKALTILKGSLKIKILSNFEYVKGDVRNGGYIKSKEYLNDVDIRFSLENTRAELYEEELLLEDLEPHSNVKKLALYFYKGRQMPSWAREDHLATLLPNLVNIELCACEQLQHLPSLGRLHHLNSLTISELAELEYIESTTNKVIVSYSSGASGSETFFPFLKVLRLEHLPKLKGWWRDDDTNGGGVSRLLPSFPSLSELYIWYCPNLICFPTCPTVEKLDLGGELNEQLRIMNGNAIDSQMGIASKRIPMSIRDAYTMG